MTVLTTEGFFSIALGIARWGSNLGEVMYDEALKFIGERFSDSPLRGKLEEEVTFFREALQTQYNVFFPFRDLAHESSETQIFVAMCNALSRKSTLPGPAG